jgi:hypothetical protein
VGFLSGDRDKAITAENAEVAEEDKFFAADHADVADSIC